MQSRSWAPTVVKQGDDNGEERNKRDDHAVSRWQFAAGQLFHVLT